MARVFLKNHRIVMAAGKVCLGDVCPTDCGMGGDTLYFPIFYCDGTLSGYYYTGPPPAEGINEVTVNDPVAPVLLFCGYTVSTVIRSGVPELPDGGILVAADKLIDNPAGCVAGFCDDDDHGGGDPPVLPGCDCDPNSLLTTYVQATYTTYGAQNNCNGCKTTSTFPAAFASRATFEDGYIATWTYREDDDAYEGSCEPVGEQDRIEYTITFACYTQDSIAKKIWTIQSALLGAGTTQFLVQADGDCCGVTAAGIAMDDDAYFCGNGMTVDLDLQLIGGPCGDGDLP